MHEQPENTKQSALEILVKRPDHFGVITFLFLGDFGQTGRIRTYLVVVYQEKSYLTVFDNIWSKWVPVGPEARAVSGLRPTQPPGTREV